MKRKSVHEPKAKIMSAAEAWKDAATGRSGIATKLVESRTNSRAAHPVVGLLSGFDDLSREELIILRKRVDECLVA